MRAAQQQQHQSKTKERHMTKRINSRTSKKKSGHLTASILKFRMIDLNRFVFHCARVLYTILVKWMRCDPKNAKINLTLTNQTVILHKRSPTWDIITIIIIIIAVVWCALAIIAAPTDARSFVWAHTTCDDDDNDQKSNKNRLEIIITVLNLKKSSANVCKAEISVKPRDALALGTHLYHLTNARQSDHERVRWGKMFVCVCMVFCECRPRSCIKCYGNFQKNPTKKTTVSRIMERYDFCAMCQSLGKLIDAYQHRHSKCLQLK